MKLEWMEQHRSLVEKLIKYGNSYAFLFKRQKSYGTDEIFSASQIQTLEYILEAEDSDETMSQMAARLGVSRGTFSKNVKSLMEKGLLDKFHCNGNRKNIYVKPTEKGRETYKAYTDFVSVSLFKGMFDIASKISPEEKKLFEEMLDVFSIQLLWYQNTENDKSEPKIFTKIE